jgi:ABC-2 type transport system permease protein
MYALRSWRALLVREYLEHRIAFVYFPLGILGLMALSAASGFAVNRVHFVQNVNLGHTLKLFEIGYLILLALWLAYLAVALFFYFGDAFSADRRNNAMLFWKSMPVSDLKMVVSKFLAGTTMFPLLVFVVGVLSGLLLYAAVGAVALVLPGFVPPTLAEAGMSMLNITLFGLVYVALSMLWYAPFMAWVGGLSTIFGRWSLPLAFVIPGVLVIIENMVFFGQVPRGGYLWAYLSTRWHFGLSDAELGFLVAAPVAFDARTYVWLLWRGIDWVAMAEGLAFTAIILALAAEYRRRRIT